MSKAKKTRGQAKPQPTPAVLGAAEAWWGKVESDPDQALAEIAALAAAEPEAAVVRLEGLLDRPGPGAARVAAGLSLEPVSKRVKKAARRAAYVLKNKGYEAPAQAPETRRPVFRPAEAPPPFGYVSGYYLDGSQLAYIALTRPGLQPVGGAAVIHYAEGITQLSLAPMGLRRFEDLAAEAGSELEWPLARLAGAELVWLLGAALEMTASTADPELVFLRDYLAARPEIRDGSAEEGNLLARLIPGPVRDGTASLERLAALLDEPPCTYWRPDIEAWSAVLQEFKDRTDSGLILTPEQRTRQAEDFLRARTTELFPADKRPAWRRRLLETAVWLASQDRRAEAAVFLAGAEAIDAADHPLFAALIDKAWQETASAVEGEAVGSGGEAGPEEGPGLIAPPEGGLIVPPGFRRDEE